MKGIVLAAGDGGRLHPITLHTPKVLLKVGGRPLIHHAIDALITAGISDIAVIVGHMGGLVSRALKGHYPDLTFIHNPQHHGENAMSVYYAQRFVSNEPFFVCMGDHLIGPEMVLKPLPFSQERSVLCVDFLAGDPSQISDATRVRLDADGFIQEIGKELHDWTAVDTGVFRMLPDVFTAIATLMESQGPFVGITDLVRYMGSIGRPFATCDVSGSLWADVDTEEDYRSLHQLIRRRHEERL